MNGTGPVAQTAGDTKTSGTQPPKKELFGDFLRRERRSRNLTQGQLSESWGKSQTAISDYENNRRTIEPGDAQPLADALGLTVDIVLEAAGFRADHVVAEKSVHRFVIGEFAGKPVEIMLRAAPKADQLTRMRLAAQIIFSETKAVDE